MSTNGRCDLPCFWGLTPEESPLSSASILFSELGSRGGVVFEGPAGPVYDTGRDFHPQLSVHPSFTLSGQAIRAIYVGLGGDTIQAAGDSGSYFSFIDMLNRYGAPNRVGLEVYTRGEIGYPRLTGYELYLFYDDIPAIIDYHGIAAKLGQVYRVCPITPARGGTEGREGIEAITLSVQSPSATYPLEQLRYLIGGLPIAPRDLEVVAGLTPQEFFDYFTEKNGICFETSLDLW
jgi:hypothetical protein